MLMVNLVAWLLKLYLFLSGVCFLPSLNVRVEIVRICMDDVRHECTFILGVMNVISFQWPLVSHTRPSYAYCIWPTTETVTCTLGFVQWLEEGPLLRPRLPMLMVNLVAWLLKLYLFLSGVDYYRRFMMISISYFPPSFWTHTCSIHHWYIVLRQGTSSAPRTPLLCHRIQCTIRTKSSVECAERSLLDQICFSYFVSWFCSWLIDIFDWISKHIHIFTVALHNENWILTVTNKRVSFQLHTITEN